MTLVVDASVVVASLIDRGAHGGWARFILAGDELAAPHQMPAEVANTLRNSTQRGVTPEDASRAYAELLRLEVGLHPYGLLADRIWELRGQITPNDAWYVALAEALDADLATLDRRLARAEGPRCTFVTPPE